ncbi:ABC transporter permease [Ideonella livida]|uniref:ABC transporter permease n=1 Tax=Ideonella livida TaxID=2707176 RepID=A0A7C9TI98_9BURK|nr:ABC transporter permease [Ideonella livida]NDY90103.1 ABC transporter permease [Ideonella livida]
MPKFVLLWTDAALWLLVLSLVGYAFMVRRQPDLRATWGKVFRNAPALASSVVLLVCLAVTLLDSVHFRPVLPAAQGQQSDMVVYDTRVRSVLDLLTQDLIDSRETTYSRPLSYVSFTKESRDLPGGGTERHAPRLQHGGAHLQDPAREWATDVTVRALTGAGVGLVVGMALCGAALWLLGRGASGGTGQMWRRIRDRETSIPWHVAGRTVMALSLLVGVVGALAGPYHVLGTDVTGNDVLYQALKSIRTAFVIGALATLATLPLAVVLGIMAGFFKGWVDELIQYVYTVLSSIPNILLIAACVLMVQVFLDKHPEFFETGLERADLKLFLLCAVLGLTGWAGLCRLLRGETLKLRELEYVQAAQAFGVSPWRIMVRHVFPNVAHLMLIVTVIEFSSLILYEAVLSYVGVGVDPSMNSFGGMINFARSEMSRDPVIWWTFACAFFFMVSLVLAANLFADGVQEAFDPRARTLKPRVARPKQSKA